MKMIRLPFLFVLFSAPGWAQLATFGVQVGAPAQIPLGQSINKMPFVFGPSVNVRGSSNLSLESGVMFYRLGERSDDTLFFGTPEGAFTLGWERWRGSAIELPFLVRYRFLGERRGWQPFISAGPALRRTSIDSTRVTTTLGGQPSGGTIAPAVDTTSVRWNVDPVAGVGVSLRTGRSSVEPQVRYSYWGAGTHSVVLQNQVYFLVNFRF
jgi:hypothetical protein